MRKHFLLLFLMALLPLAGWADAPTITLSKTQYTYIGGSMRTAVTAKINSSTDYDGDVLFYKLVGESLVNADPINVGTYYVSVVNGGNESNKVSFQIMPKDLELTATQVEVGYGNYSAIAGGADIPSGYYTTTSALQMQ